MKKEDFFKLMDGIDDRLVEKYAISDEAEAKQKQIRRQRRQRWLNQVTGCAVAAIILGVIGVAMLCASFGVVRMDRQSPKTPVSLGDGNDSQNNENNGGKRAFGTGIPFLYWSGGAGHSRNPKDGSAARNDSSYKRGQ